MTGSVCRRRCDGLVGAALAALKLEVAQVLFGNLHENGASLTTPLIEILTFRGPPRFSLQDTHWTLSAEGFRVTRKCFGLGWVGGGLGAHVKVQDSFPNDGLGTHWSAGSRHTQNMQTCKVFANRLSFNRGGVGGTRGGASPSTEG